MLGFSYILYVFVGAFAMGLGWAKIQREAEKEIQIYVAELDVDRMDQLLRYSKELMEKAKARNGPDGVRSQGYAVAKTDFPVELKGRQLSSISYFENEVDYSWTGGVIGRIGIRVEKSDSALTAYATMTPDTATIQIYPIDR